MSNVISLPAVQSDNIPDQLRELADRIELGGLGAVHSVTWVADVDSGKVDVGLCGTSPIPGATAHLMLAMGMRKLELLGSD